jgi:broad specificity phosphatase PhoE
MPIIAKAFYMIRHGETEANKARIMAGSVDSPLTQLGRDQADQARQVIEQLAEKPSVIIHSQLSRARDTARIINQNLGLPMIEDPDYAEMHAGDWEGISYDDCHTMMRGWQDPPNGESFEAFFTRIKRAKNKALKETEGTPLIVCHGGVFRAFAKLYGLETWGVMNCHLHHFAPAPMVKHFPWTALSFTYDEEVRSDISESFL